MLSSKDIAALQHYFRIINEFNHLHQMDRSHAGDIRAGLDALAGLCDELIDKVDVELDQEHKDIEKMVSLQILNPQNEQPQESAAGEDVDEPVAQEDDIFGAGPALADDAQVIEQIPLKLKPEAPKLEDCGCQHCTGSPRPTGQTPTGIIEVE